MVILFLITAAKVVFFSIFPFLEEGVPEGQGS